MRLYFGAMTSMRIMATHCDSFQSLNQSGHVKSIKPKHKERYTPAQTCTLTCFASDSNFKTPWSYVFKTKSVIPSLKYICTSRLQFHNYSCLLYTYSYPFAIFLEQYKNAPLFSIPVIDESP